MEDEAPKPQTHLQKLLDRVMRERNFNEHGLAIAAGLKPDAVRDIMRKGTKNPQVKTLMGLSSYLEMSIPALLGVEGVTLGMPQPKDRAPTGAPSLPEHTPALPGVAEIDVLGGLGSGSESVVEAFTLGDGSIVAAEAIKDYWGVPDDYLRGELRMSRARVRIMEVRGDSMAPTLNSGDRVMVDLKDKLPSPGGMFAYFDGYGVSVKRVEIVEGASPPSLRLSSDNPNHGTYVVTAEEAHIIGRVILQIRRV